MFNYDIHNCKNKVKTFEVTTYYGNQIIAIIRENATFSKEYVCFLRIMITYCHWNAFDMYIFYRILVIHVAYF